MIPIFKADCLEGESQTEAVGYFHKVPVDVDLAYADIMAGNYIFDRKDGVTAYEINTDTLKMSLDGGKSWIKLADLEVHTCTDFKLKYNDMKRFKKSVDQPPNGSIFTVITDKGR